MARPEQQSGSTGNRFARHQIIQPDACGFLTAGLAGNQRFANIFAFLGHAGFRTRTVPSFERPQEKSILPSHELRRMMYKLLRSRTLSTILSRLRFESN